MPSDNTKNLSNPGWLRTGRGVLLLGLAYFLLGLAGLQLAIPPGFASAVFPAAGVGFVVVLLAGNRLLPGVWLGSAGINLWIASGHGSLGLSVMGMAATIALGSTIQAWAAATLVRRWQAKTWHRLDNEADIIRFLLLAGPVACLVSASWGSSTLLLFKVITVAEFSANWANWWIGDSIGVLLFAPLTLMALQYRDPLWRSRLKSVAVPTLIATAGMIATFVYVSHSELVYLKQRIAESGLTIAGQLEAENSSHREIVTSLGNLVQLAPSLNHQDFERYASRNFETHRDLHGLSWNPLIVDAGRKRFEAELSRELGSPALRITESGPQHRLIPAARRSHYVPVRYIVPLDANRNALGYDIASNPERNAAIQVAIQTRQMALTPPIRLVQETGTSVGVLAIYPVYLQPGQAGRDHAAGDGLYGFAVGVFRLQAMLSQVLAPTQLSGLAVRLEDKQAAPASQLLFSNGQVPDSSLADLAWHKPIRIADRTWQLSLYPTSAYIAQNQSLLIWMVLAGGLMLASLLQSFMLAMTGRASVVQRLVEEQTGKLIAQEEATRQASQYARSLIEASLDPLVTISAAGKITDVNRATEKFTGVSRERLIGSDFADYFTDPDKAREVYQQVFSHGDVTDYPLVIRHQSGQVSEVLYNATLYRDINGNALGVLAAARDVTEQAKAQQAIREAKEMAERIARLRSEFLANMSHEIRTPMNGIIGLSQLALNQPTTPQVRDYLQKIASSSQSLLGILNDVLDFSKIEAGRMSIEQRPFDLEQVVGNLRNLFEERAQSKQLEFSIEIDADTPRSLVGDAMRIQQILSNLLGNAVKFTAQGHVALRIGVLEADSVQARLSFAVEDTGIGIAEQDLGKLFQPFSQVDGTITRRFGGTGLGLVISQKLLNLMGGEFDIRSRQGAGTTIRFELQLGVGPAQAPSETPLSLRSEAGDLEQVLHHQGDALEGARILVAEDNTINQQVVREFLSLSGMQVAIAGNGQEALEMLERQPFDAVLMDVHMPLIGGWEATRRIRADARFADLPVIALSAGVTQEEREKSLASGMNDFLPKPVNPEGLVNTLSKWIKRDMSTIPAPVNVEQASWEEIAAALPEFDLTTLQRMIGGRSALLLSMLQTFREDYVAEQEAVTAALQAGDLAAAERLLHRLKGAAGSIGAMQLHQASEVLDAQLKQGRYEPAALEDWLRAHAATLQQLAGCLAAWAPQKPAS